ncbi:immunoglobulin kappa light chain-like [Rhinatrema bivittatum]|uniref:immunoglobulin kappa light chain-like n=1 Tax=Rhinatrema bivittatum TaxID=194408 RepID=UPI0011269814|nr:immunoglobulin kappa light chain-like [Rhinatrema bivittatum]
MSEKNPRIACTVHGSKVISHVLSWYKQPWEQGLSFLVSHRDMGKPSYAEGVSERFMPEIDRVTNSFTLLIGNAEKKDAGIYYCAIWYANRYIFGEGTEVIFQEENDIKEPSVELLGPSAWELRHQQAATFLCQAMAFYPKAIRIKWLVGGLQNMANTEIFLSLKNEDGNFQKVGRLTVSTEVWEEGADITCRVEHESGTKLLRAKEKWKSDKKECELTAAVGETEGTAHLNQESISENSTHPALGDLTGMLVSVFYAYLGMLSISIMYTLILVTWTCKVNVDNHGRRQAKEHAGQQTVAFIGGN